MNMGFGLMLMLGLACLIGAMMWDGGVNSAWQDLNQSTTVNTTSHAAAQAGQIFGGGFGIALAAIGILLVVGAIIMLVRDISGGR